MSRNILKPLLLLFAMGLSACAQEAPVQSGQNTVISGAANIGGAFSLIDHNGRPVSDADYKGKPLLMYFGFAYCPDVCPTSLQKMGAALSLVGGDKDYFQSLLITVDPERDTPEQLALYVTAPGFPENLIGLTGTQAQIDTVKSAYSAIGNKLEDKESAAGYTYSHTDFIYLMDKDGKFVDIFSTSDTPQTIANRLKSYKKTGR